MKYDAFISYSSKDKMPLEVCYALEQRGARCWIAPRDIQKGVPYARAIMKAMEEAETVLVFISASSLGSEDVLNEIDNAQGMKKPIIPVFIEKVELNSEFSYYLKRKQWVEGYRGLNECVSELMEALKLEGQPSEGESNYQKTQKFVKAKIKSGMARKFGSILAYVADALKQKYPENAPVLSPPPFDVDYLMDKIQNMTDKTRDDDFLMPVENVFNITDRGAVAVGRLEGGMINTGDQVWVVGGDKIQRCQVTGVEMFRKLLDCAEAGDNCGLLLSGVEKKNLRRGMVVTKKKVSPVKEFTAAAYILSRENGNPYDISLGVGMGVEIHNRTATEKAEVTATEGGVLANGEYGSVRFRLSEGIFLQEDDVVVVKYKNETVGVGVVIGIKAEAEADDFSKTTDTGNIIGSI